MVVLRLGGSEGAGMAIVEETEHRVERAVEPGVVLRRRRFRPIGHCGRVPIHALKLRVVILPVHGVPDGVEDPEILGGLAELGGR